MDDSYEPAVRRFETFEPDGPGRDATELRAVAAAVAAGETESRVRDAVVAARRADHPWSVIAVMLGVSPQAAQHRYGSRAGEYPT